MRNIYIFRNFKFRNLRRLHPEIHRRLINIRHILFYVSLEFEKNGFCVKINNNELDIKDIVYKPRIKINY